MSLCSTDNLIIEISPNLIAHRQRAKISTPQWCREQKLKFVREYVKHKALLIAGCKNETKNRKLLRKAALVELSNSMGMPGFGPKEAYAKVRNIRSTYAQELKKIRKAAAHGSVYVPNLIWFKTLDSVYKSLTKEECTLCTEASGIDSNPSVSTAEIEAATSLLNETNADYTVKLELFEEEDCTSTAMDYLEKHTENGTEHPKTRIVNAPLDEGPRNCVNCKGFIDASKPGNTCDKCEGMINQLVHKNEFDVFGESIAAQLKNMPLVNALEAQMYIQNYLSNLRLQSLRFQSSC